MAEMPNPDGLANVKAECPPENVVFKGYKSGLTMVIADVGPLEGYLQEIRSKLEQSHDFFKGANIIIDPGKRILTEEERLLLMELVKKFGLNPRWAEKPKAKAVTKADNERALLEADQFKATITVKKTVRSGQRISFEGNLVIMGDVNPGAEVIASGDIIVLGRLRGTAHAGAEGDETSQIIAFQLRPVQIRIAGVITRDSESDPKVEYVGPEVAKIKSGMIVVERVNY
ncbi:MAG TPA: septum site-determining protein MinC [Firmicutes bacterium]|jgi:septum site-determining protein MinC|nr:septum site-determining protein MinC [Bacillota bacterium]